MQVLSDETMEDLDSRVCSGEKKQYTQQDTACLARALIMTKSLKVKVVKLALGSSG